MTGRRTPSAEGTNEYGGTGVSRRMREAPALFVFRGMTARAALDIPPSILYILKNEPKERLT